MKYVRVLSERYYCILEDHERPQHRHFYVRMTLTEMCRAASLQVLQRKCIQPLLVQGQPLVRRCWQFLGSSSTPPK